MLNLLHAYAQPVNVTNTTSVSPTYPHLTCESANTCNVFVGKLTVLVLVLPNPQINAAQPPSELFLTSVMDSKGAIVSAFPGSATGTTLTVVAGKYVVNTLGLQYPPCVQGVSCTSNSFVPRYGGDCDSGGNVGVDAKKESVCIVIASPQIG